MTDIRLFKSPEGIVVHPQPVPEEDLHQLVIRLVQYLADRQPDQVVGAAPEPEQGISIAQALALAEREGYVVSRRTVLNAAREGRIARARFEGNQMWLFPEADFLAWLSSRRRRRKKPGS
jgi:hypothetical protein